MYNFFFNLFGKPKKKVVYKTTKPFIEETFTSKNYLGRLSDTVVSSLEQADLLAERLSYTTTPYTNYYGGETYLSFERVHVPIIGNRVGLVIRDGVYFYSYILLNDKGKILGVHLFKTIKQP